MQNTASAHTGKLMASNYIWFKALHVVFMVTWYAGLFYLPRLFIYHVQAADSGSRERFTVMERRLFAIMTLGAILTAVFGLILIGIVPPIAETGWFMAKSVLLIGLIIYHYRCWLWIRRLQETNEIQDSKWLRWFNEIPTVILFGIVLLAIVKPF